MGLTVIDAGVIIGILDSYDAHHESSLASLRNSRELNRSIAVPASALAECLVGPTRSGTDAIATLHEFLARVPIDVAELNAETAEIAARIRVLNRSVKLPDALVIATAVQLDADELIITDRGWPSRSKLGIRAQLIVL